MLPSVVGPANCLLPDMYYAQMPLKALDFASDLVECFLTCRCLFAAWPQLRRIESSKALYASE